MIFEKIKNYLGAKYQPLNKIEILKANLLQNYQYLASQGDSLQIAPVLKSNAYGHGLELIGKIVDEIKPPFLCVDSLFEAYKLLNAGVKTKILIMGYVDAENLKIKELPFSYAVYSLEHLLLLQKAQPQASFHLFVDTGLHREGIRIEELEKMAVQIKKMKDLQIEGVMSHLAAGDRYDDQRTITQLQNFEKAQQILAKYQIFPQWQHLLASTGFLNYRYFKKYKVGNLARIGRIFYGIDPLKKNTALKPVLQLKSKIVQLKTIKKDEFVGYDFSYQAKKEMTIAILPIGYNDGLDRRLSNRGYVLVKNVKCKILGRVSMNITVIDVSKVKQPRVGDSALIYSANDSDLNSVRNAAKLCNTIPYNLLVNIDSSVRREVV